MIEKKTQFQDALERIRSRLGSQGISVHDLLESLGDEADHILVLVLVLPFLQPIAIPGLSVPLGVLVIILGVYQLLRKPFWVPEFLSQKRISKDVVEGSMTIALKAYKILSKISKPRWSILIEGLFFRGISFLVVFFSAFLLSLPIPLPFTNLVPGIAIFLNALGRLEEDGFLIVASYVLFVIVVVGFYFIYSAAAGLAGHA